MSMLFVGPVTGALLIGILDESERHRTINPLERTSRSASLSLANCLDFSLEMFAFYPLVPYSYNSLSSLKLKAEEY